MPLFKQSFLGVSITTSPKSEILAFVQSFLSKPTRLRQGFGGQATIIVTPNPEQIMLAQRNERFRTILNSADITLPDGAGVVWGINRQLKTKIASPDDDVGIAMTKLISRISGVDFMDELCQLAVKNHWKVALIGGRNGVAKEALSVLQKKYPGMEGWAEEGGEIQMENGEWRMDNEKINLNDMMSLFARRIAESGTKIVFVGLGAPKQEFFIDLLRKKPVVLMSVGGAFDTISGRIPRAPVFLRNLNLEWLYRLLREPWRIKRQLQLLKFVFRVLVKN